MESPTSKAPVSTAVPTATPHATARFIRQWYSNDRRIKARTVMAD